MGRRTGVGCVRGTGPYIGQRGLDAVFERGLCRCAHISAGFRLSLLGLRLPDEAPLQSSEERINVMRSQSGMLRRVLHRENRKFTIECKPSSFLV